MRAERKLDNIFNYLVLQPVDMAKKYKYLDVSQHVYKHKRKTRRGCRGEKNKRRNYNINEAGRTRAANHQKARPKVTNQNEARPRAASGQNMRKVRQVDDIQ